MPLAIFDGPEAAGKSTIIDELLKVWGPNSRLRSWGPRESWLEYCQPLFDDVQACKEDPHLLIAWSRSWLSRTVYNRLLTQGQSVPSRVTLELDNIVIASGGLLFLVVAPPRDLVARRLRRFEAGKKKDHPLDPHKELTQFLASVQKRKWRQLSGAIPPGDNVRSIILALVQKNPECRMEIRKEEPIDEIVLTDGRVDFSKLRGRRG